MKLNLLNNGTKSTTGDGVWGELVLKTEEDTFIGWINGDDKDEMNDEYIDANTGLKGGDPKRNFGLKVYVDVAKIHIGPAKYSEGIILGVDTKVAKVDLDLRSYVEDNSTHETAKNSYQYTGAYAAALEAELKGESIGLDGSSAKVGTSFNFGKNYQADKDADNKIDIPETHEHLWGYSVALAYKLGLDDTFYIRPQVGFTGQTMFYNNDDVKTKTANTNNLAVATGLLFCWDEIGLDQDAGVTTWMMTWPRRFLLVLV